MIENIAGFAKVSFTLRNERNRQQLTMVHHQSLWEKLMGEPAFTLVVEMYNGEWVNVATGQFADEFYSAKFFNLKKRVLYLEESQKLTK